MLTVYGDTYGKGELSSDHPSKAIRRGEGWRKDGK
jgi:hypothetical protein